MEIYGTEENKIDKSVVEAVVKKVERIKKSAEVKSENMTAAKK